MKERIKTKRTDLYISAIISLVIGILFIVFPIGTQATLATIIGIAVLAVAIITIIGAIAVGLRDSISALLIAVLLAILGIWIIARPVDFVRLFPIAIGIVIAVHGIQDFITAFSARSAGARTWYLMLIGGIIDILFGFICISCSFGVLTASGIMIGCILVYDSVITFIIAMRGSHYKNGDKIEHSKVIK